MFYNINLVYTYYVNQNPKRILKRRKKKSIIDKIQRKRSRPSKEKQHIELTPQNNNPAHYHKGRRGKCKCDNPEKETS